MTDSTLQTTAPLNSPPCDLQRAAVMRFLQDEVLRDRDEEDRSFAVLSSFISGLQDGEWQIVQDRMMEPMSQTRLVEESSRIIDIVSELLLPLLNPPSSGPTSPLEDIQHFSGETVKRVLTSLLLPPPSWGMGRAIKVQSSQTSAARFSESTALYDSIISQYAQVMGQLVMSGLSRSSESLLDRVDKTHDGQTSRSKNTAGFFQTLKRSLRSQWRRMKSSRDRYSSPSADTEDQKPSRFEDVQQMKKMVFHFLQSLPAKIEKRICDNAPSHWQATALFPV